MTTARDFLFAIVAIVTALGLGLTLFLTRRAVASLLTPREWRIFFKLVGIVALAALLLFTNIAVEFPAEMFIYGRF